MWGDTGTKACGWMERVEGKGWGKREIKMHTVRHTDKAPEGGPVPGTQSCSGKQGQRGNMMSHKGEKLPEVPQVT